jgi:hypothetical protein
MRPLSTSPSTFSDPPFGRQPGPLPLGDKKDQKEMEKLIKQYNDSVSSPTKPDDAATAQHPDAEKEPLKGFENNVNPETGERNGPKGPEPTRYGDWERKGRVFGRLNSTKCLTF